MHPRVKKSIESASRIYGVPVDDLIGPRKRRYTEAVNARHSVIRELYDPATAGVRSSYSFRWGSAEIGRQLGMDHTSILYAVEKMGLRP